MRHLNTRSIKSECGASLVEYSLLVALISIISLAGVSSFGENVSAKFEKIAVDVENAGHGGAAACGAGQGGQCPPPPPGG